MPAQRSRKTWRRPSNPAGMSNFLSSRSNCSVPDLTVREILMMNEHMSNTAAAQNILTKTLLYKKQVQPKAAGENSNSLVILYFKQHIISIYKISIVSPILWSSEQEAKSLPEITKSVARLIPAYSLGCLSKPFLYLQHRLF